MPRLCPLADLPVGEGVRFDSVSPPIAVFRDEDDTVYAIDDTCTHQDASLAEGWMEDCMVECPLHESRFSLLTGDVDQPPAKAPVRVHSARVEDGEVYVELSTAAPNLPPGVTFGGAS